MPTTLTQAEQPMNSVDAKKSPFITMKNKWTQFNNGDKQVAILAVFAIVVACVIVLMLWTASQGYRPLYGNQEKVESSEIIEVLESEGISYRLDTNSGLILVPEERLGKARMILAARGVKAELPMGMEALETSGIGTSQFMEQAKYRYSLEGELSRTIMALRSVRTARVHLAIPKKTLFIRQQPELPSASVMLDLYAGANIQTEQVESIVNLVAGSVTGMTAERVQVVDQQGNHLSSALTLNNDITQARDRQLKYTHELEQNLINRASSMLLPILGQENFQVQVAAQVNFNQVEETNESLDPQGIVTREQQSSNEVNGELAMGIPGALSNQAPNADAYAANNPRRNVTQQTNRNFEVGRSIKHTRYQQMQLENVSISVLLNNQAAGEDGWSQQQLDSLSSMVQDAIGFTAARGDQFSINSFDFAPVRIAEFQPMPWWQTEGYESYLRYLIGCLLGLGLIFFVLRPLVRHLTTTVDLSALKDNDQQTESLEYSEPKAAPLVNNSDDPQAIADQLMGLGQPKSDADLMSIGLPETSSPLKVKMEHLSLLAEKEPARVAEVIANWISDKDGKQQ
ncbi:flagellar basal-body MS-ring/collar protein FliF [Shewanella sp. 4_MG-2023]|uniref:flagellar basal-body MS-ring/collar protein FliF n=1 Tax=Shewanella sp. 4_MG-2023 TaxID=3062652 RepID=UPI0026E19D0A|nr:flagellar basal-body MS-ring/collar protein FliF [Shewanella sp. 4_MG-2023]MDO6680260.1 flagellar basal-body MS-ring/collar protein FliF [Shewanella sp. 4_MG-2023]